VEKCTTKKTYKTKEGLSGIVLQTAIVFPHMKIVALKHGECDWRITYINESDLIFPERKKDD